MSSTACSVIGTPIAAETCSWTRRANVCGARFSSSDGLLTGRNSISSMFLTWQRSLKASIGSPGPAKTQVGSQCRKLYRRTAAWTGRPGAKAPSLKVMSVLRFFVVPSGKTRMGAALPAAASEAAEAILSRASRRDSEPLRSKQTTPSASPKTCITGCLKLLSSANTRGVETAIQTAPSRNEQWFETSTPTPGACRPRTRIR
mmetsp:Transcript_104813/g.306096  ORF Transcript_104813/g.306096 Transcript_104813/m.306096 type:complete len:202 (+) Transcript_104813:1275-1880(+)